MRHLFSGPVIVTLSAVLLTSATEIVGASVRLGAAVQDSTCIRWGGHSGPDITGVQLGMSVHEILVVTACEHPALAVHEEYLRSTQPLPDGRRPTTIVVFEGPSERMTFQFAGLPGEESLVGLERRIQYAPADQPTFASVREAMEEKYGKLEPLHPAAPSGSSYVVARLESFTGVSQVISPLSMCFHDVGLSGSGIFILRDQCGRLVGARAYASKNNPNLVESLVVVLSDGQTAARLRAEYEAARLSAIRRMQEDDARRAQGRKPRL